jgi:hypothetical protein
MKKPDRGMPNDTTRWWKVKAQQGTILLRLLEAIVGIVKAFL